MYSKETRAGKKNRFGKTEIIGGNYNNLYISWDSDDNSIENSYPIFLYTPRMEDTDTHYHFQLNKKQAKKLKDWLTDFLKDNK